MHWLQTKCPRPDGGGRHEQAAQRVRVRMPLVDLVDQFITELKRLEIWPDDFARACSARGMTDKDRELLELYERYQQRLVDHQLFDAEGCYWAARSLLQSGQRRPFKNVQFVVVDGFTDFTRTQHEMLQALAEQGSAIAISLPLEAAEAGQPPRSDLFAKTNRTLQELRERHTQLQVESLPRF